MRFRRISLAAVVLLLLNLVVVEPSWAATTTAASTGQTILQISKGGSTSFQSAPLNSDVSVASNEVDSIDMDGDVAGATGTGAMNPAHSARTISKGNSGKSRPASSAKVTKSNPEILQSFEGLNFYQQRFANGGNQFSVEPPDQALCVGNGYVVEAVNDVLRIFDSGGKAVSGVVDLNTFYGYPAAINRTNGKYGPSITDPVCHFDTGTQRFFMVVLTLDRVGTTSTLSGTNHLDIAVSNSAKPTDGWTIYKLPAQNNGTGGTPDHRCDGGYCLGDYPHIGADANGIYLTTNEFATLGDGFYGAQIYAISKRALASGTATIPVVLFNTLGLGPKEDGSGFTVWPAISPAGQFNTDNGGTEFLLSSDAVFTDSGLSSQLIQWKLTNTASLDSAAPALRLGIDVIPTQGYAVPPQANQKAGNTPLRDCIADATCAPRTGAYKFSNPISGLDANDSRMQQVFYANGKLWGALDTGLTFDNGLTAVAGIAYFVINPNSKKVMKQGYLGMDKNNLTYPAVGVTASGRGVIAFTLVGADFYPSAAYASLDALAGAGDIKVAASGAGPQDGFSGYLPFSDRPRWGDYGAAAVDGDTIWIASEYIAQTCTFAEYQAAPFGTCGGTRGTLGNWSTRVTSLSTKR